MSTPILDIPLKRRPPRAEDFAFLSGYKARTDGEEQYVRWLAKVLQPYGWTWPVVPRSRRWLRIYRKGKGE